MSGPSMAAANSHSKNDDEQRSEDPFLPSNEEEWNSYLEGSSPVHDPSVVCIFRVPPTLMNVSKNGGAYVPQRVSLGPHDHRSAQLVSMEHHKRRALYRMMKRSSLHHHRPNNMDFAVRARNAIMDVQEGIKNNYSGIVRYEGEILAKILTLDGCFILEIMRVLVSDIEGGDPLFERRTLRNVERDLVVDILKLENQIPFIVLQKLLQLELQQDDVKDTLCKIVLRFLLKFYPFGKKEKEAYVNDGDLLSIFKKLQEEQGHHLLDFFRTLVVFSPVDDDRDNSVSIDVVHTGGEHPQYRRLSNDEGKDEYSVAADIPRAVDLANAGVKFRKCRGGIKDIHFEPKRATMYLPSLTLTDRTELRFLNLVAFELQKRFQTNDVMNYMYLMKKLVVSEEDVLLLKREGLVGNYGGTDKEIAEVFNNISKGIVIDSKHFMDGLAGQVMGVYRNNKWNRYRTALLNEYFSTPLKTLGLVAATLLVALTIVQTIFTILALYK